MNRGPFIIALLGAFGLTSGCALPGPDEDGVAGGPPASSSETAAHDGVDGNTTPICSGSAPSGACILPMNGIPFAREALPYTDGVSTARVTNSTPGTVCLSGTLADAGPTLDSRSSLLYLRFAELSESRTRIVAPFNADELGITQIQFELEILPTAGFAPGPVDVVVAMDGVLDLRTCAESPFGCVTPHSFQLTNEMGAQERIHASRTITAPLSAFKDLWGDGSQKLDPARVNALMFGVGKAQTTSLGYDFCVHGLRFLDADGKEVVPAN